MSHKLISESETKIAEKLLTLQVLRAIAAVMVAIEHISEEAKYFFGFQPWIETIPFAKGVDLFFVISGFIIYYSSKAGRNGQLRPSDFILNRFIRVAPLYYIFTTLMVLVVYFLPSGVKEARFDIWQIIASYTFIPYERYDGRVAPILSLGWTLNYEIFFYALFAICLFLKSRAIVLSIVTAIFSLAILGGILPDSAPTVLTTWCNNIIIEFAFGVIIAYIFEQYGRIPKASFLKALCLAVPSFLLLYFLNLPEKILDAPRFITAGIPSALIVAAAVLLTPIRIEPLIPRWLIVLGDSSYSLYLSHRFVLRPIQIAFKHTGLGKLQYAGSIYLMIALICACVVSYLVFSLLEKPLLRVLRQKFHRNIKT